MFKRIRTKEIYNKTNEWRDIFSDSSYHLNLSNEIFITGFVHANNVNNLLALQKGGTEMVLSLFNVMIMI